MKKVIMIEGKACSGKGTIAKELANEIGYTYIDAGLIFRSVVYLKGTASKAEYLSKNKQAVIGIMSGFWMDIIKIQNNFQ